MEEPYVRKVQYYEQALADFKNINKINEAAEKSNIALQNEKALIEDKSAIAQLEALENEQKAYENLSKYLKPNRLEDGTLELEFDEELFEGDRRTGQVSEETYNSIKQIYDDLNTANEDLKSAQTSVLNRLKGLYEELASLKEEYANYAEDLLEAYEKVKQDELDKQEKLFESLNNNLKDLLEEIKKRLDQRRQQEDNIKTETDLAKKQQRLAVLRADTSGGNASAIKQLQQEIADSQQSYERSLEDQLLSKLEEQADKAAEQRERQIRLQQASLDIAHFTGENVKVIEKYLSNPQQYQSEIRKLWEGDEFVSKLDISTEIAEADWTQLWNSITNFENKEGILKAAIGISEETLTELNTQLQDFNKSCDSLIKQLEAEAEKIKAEEEKERIKEIGDSLNGVSLKFDIGVDTFGSNVQNFAKAVEAFVGKEPNEGEPNEEGSNDVVSAVELNELLDKYLNARNGDKETVQNTLEELKRVIPTLDLGDDELERWNTRIEELERRAKVLDVATEQNPAIAIKYGTKEEKKEALRPVVETVVGGALQGVVGVLNKLKGFHFASGGMNYTTGPAWLDGTRAKPEAVLNATDTKNFIALKDVLSNAMNGVSSIQTSNVEGGPVTYDIDINVDHLNNDYDVDKVAKRVEKIITQDSSYRNVTLVRKFR